MKKLQAFADVSVCGGCLDQEFSVVGRALLDMVKRGDMFFLLSNVLLDELEGAPPEVRESLSRRLRATCGKGRGLCSDFEFVR